MTQSEWSGSNPQGAWPNLVTQPHSKAQGDLGVEKQRIKDSD